MNKFLQLFYRVNKKEYGKKETCEKEKPFTRIEERVAWEFKQRLEPLSFIQRDEILKLVVKTSLPRRHLKYCPKQVPYYK